MPPLYYFTGTIW